MSLWVQQKLNLNAWSQSQINSTMKLSIIIEYYETILSQSEEWIISQ